MSVRTRPLPFCLLAGLTVAFACQSPEPINLPILSADQAAIALNQSAYLLPDISVQVMDILDSRCPENVVCILAGTVSVKLTVTKGTDAQRVQLQAVPSTSARRIDSTGVVLGGESYKVILRDVFPYPNTSKKLPPKQAIVQVTKL